MPISAFLASRCPKTATFGKTSFADVAVTAGPAVVGALIHMMVGAMYGVLFAVIVRMAKLRGMTLILAGMIYGAVVFAVSAWVGLPLAATIFSAGDPITNMASMVGYPTFLVEHIMFGVATAFALLPFTRNRSA